MWLSKNQYYLTLRTILGFITQKSSRTKLVYFITLMWPNYELALLLFKRKKTEMIFAGLFIQQCILPLFPFSIHSLNIVRTLLIMYNAMKAAAEAKRRK